MAKEECSFCGMGFDKCDLVECPNCLRLGCEECMPGGKGVPCSDCEAEAERDAEGESERP